MIELAVKALEKITELLKYREEKGRRRFDLIAAPMYEQLLQIHSDYLRIFTDMKIALEDGEDILLTIRQLESKRIEEEALRQSVWSRAFALMRDPGLEDMKHFMQSAAWYFEPTRGLPFRSPSTRMYETAIRKWRLHQQASTTLEKDASLRAELVAAIEDHLADQRRSWGSVSQSLAILQRELQVK